MVNRLAHNSLGDHVAYCWPARWPLHLPIAIRCVYPRSFRYLQDPTGMDPVA